MIYYAPKSDKQRKRYKQIFELVLKMIPWVYGYELGINQGH